MKKLFIAFAIFGSLIFSSCYNVIFAKIMREVELEKNTISGHINNIVIFKDKVFVANGSIYSKPKVGTSHGQFSLSQNGLTQAGYNYYGEKFEGDFVYALAANESNIYALTASIVEDKDAGENYVGDISLYTSSDGTSWTKINGTVSQPATLFNDIDTSSVATKAYLKMGSGDSAKVYELSGSSFPTTEASGATAKTQSAADGKFFDEEASVKSASYYYRGSGKTLQYSTDGSSWTNAGSVDGNISALAVCSNAIIVGTRGAGLFKFALDGSGKPINRVDFETNGDAALGSPYEINSLICVNPSASETATTFYVAIDSVGSPSSSGGSFKDIGLWSYYPSRGNWNRE